MITIEIEQWKTLCGEFKLFFDSLGSVKEENNYIRFKSFSSNVSTGFSISKEGNFAASMPLHGLEGKALTVSFDKVEHAVHVHGSESKYTYRVPQELLDLRN
jgi:hypothetical protein